MLSTATYPLRLLQWQQAGALAECKIAASWLHGSHQLQDYATGWNLLVDALVSTAGSWIDRVGHIVAHIHAWRAMRPLDRGGHSGHEACKIIPNFLPLPFLINPAQGAVGREGRLHLWIGAERRKVESWVGGGSTPGWQLRIAFQLCPHLHQPPRRTPGGVPMPQCWHSWREGSASMPAAADLLQQLTWHDKVELEQPD